MVVAVVGDGGHGGMPRAHVSCSQCINEAFFAEKSNTVDVSLVKWAKRTQAREGSARGQGA